jgi:hypothetical protein
MNPARTGSLIVQATGSDQNEAWAIAGSGGIVSGNGASAKTENTSTVAAELSGGTIYAGNVSVSAVNSADYAPGVNSINASVDGASGAEAKNDYTTSATVTIGNSTAITAAGMVSIAAQNNFTQSANENASSINKGASAYAGAGGVITGAAAGNHATLTGTASVSLGDSVAIRSGTNPLTNPGGIAIVAVSGIDAQDSVLLSTGGFIEGGGTSSKIDAMIANSVTLGADNSLISWGSIAAGTFSTVDVQTTSQANTGGLAGTADAHATTSVTSNQTLTVGSNSTLYAFGNINLTAGDDPTGLTSPTFIGDSNAEAYAYGGITIPLADSTATLTSNATLTINSGTMIGSGRNVTISAFDGSPAGTQSSTTQWNGIGSPSNESATANTSTRVTQNGDITAGMFHELTLTIPDDASSGAYSNTLQIVLKRPGGTGPRRDRRQSILVHQPVPSERFHQSALQLDRSHAADGKRVERPNAGGSVHAGATVCRGRNRHGQRHAADQQRHDHRLRWANGHGHQPQPRLPGARTDPDSKRFRRPSHPERKRFGGRHGQRHRDSLGRRRRDSRGDDRANLRRFGGRCQYRPRAVCDGYDLEPGRQRVDHQRPRFARADGHHLRTAGQHRRAAWQRRDYDPAAGRRVSGHEPVFELARLHDLARRQSVHDQHAQRQSRRRLCRQCREQCQRRVRQRRRSFTKP